MGSGSVSSQLDTAISAAPDAIAADRWTELHDREHHEMIAAYFFHVERKVAAKWCWLQWVAQHEGEGER